MSFAARALRLRSTTLLSRPRTITSPITKATSARFASSDYGSPGHKDDPAAGEQKTPNPSADKEHPGPPPPKPGQGTGGATKADSQGHNTSTQQSDKRPSVGNAPTQPSGKKGYATNNYKPPKGDTKNAEPKILNESPPSDDQAPEDVKKHNAEFEGRAERPAERVKQDEIEDDKVNKGFWREDSDGKPRTG